MLYLTKKVRDNNTDNSLRQKVIDFNTEMKDIIEEVKTESFPSQEHIYHSKQGRLKQVNDGN